VQRWLGKRFPVSTDEPGPVFTTLQPHRVLWDGDRPGVADVSRLGLAEPLLDVAHLLAQLLLHGVRENRLGEVDGFGTAFRDAYLEASHRPVDRLRILEAAALLRLACIRREKHPSGEAASKLLERAERRIEGS
jgi:aminoglycoside phosphotransferase (APT) family kinase protein